MGDELQKLYYYFAFSYVSNLLVKILFARSHTSFVPKKKCLGWKWWGAEDVVWLSALIIVKQ
jgi:hypothetical protein